MHFALAVQALSTTSSTRTGHVPTPNSASSRCWPRDAPVSDCTTTNGHPNGVLQYLSYRML